MCRRKKDGFLNKDNNNVHSTKAMCIVGVGVNTRENPVKLDVIVSHVMLMLNCNGWFHEGNIFTPNFLYFIFDANHNETNLHFFVKGTEHN